MCLSRPAQRSEPDETADSDAEEAAADSDIDLDAADEPASPPPAADSDNKTESEISDAY